MLLFQEAYKMTRIHRIICCIKQFGIVIWNNVI